MEVKQINSMTQVDRTTWNCLVDDAYSFLRHEFLLALEQSGSVCERTGWVPAHLLVMDENELVAFMPLYLKQLSEQRGISSWHCLFPRYWGCHEEYNGIHFEACYYRGLDYCIEHGLERFDSGAQGEHKISRGFEPVTTYSAHWLKDARFAKAIEQFLAREQKAVQLYKQNAASYLPFKQETWLALKIKIELI